VDTPADVGIDRSIRCGDTLVTISAGSCAVDSGGDLGTKTITCTTGTAVVVTDGTTCVSPTTGVYVCGPVTVLLQGAFVTCGAGTSNPFSQSCSST
jgi:hypothetical protein